MNASRAVVRWRTLVTAALVLIVLVPAVREGDGVPLSSYSMYAAPRSGTVEFVVPVAIDGNGDQVALSTQQIASTSDPLVAESYLRDEVRAGRVDSLCLAIAVRVVSVMDPGPGVRVDIYREVHAVVDQVLGDPSLEEAEVLASCQVER